MKKVFTVAMVIAISAFSSLTATASILQDGFEGYTPGNLAGQGPWQTPPLPNNSSAIVTAGGLSANGVNGGSQKVTFRGNSNNAAITNSFTPATPDTSLFISFLLDFNGSPTRNDFFALWLNDGTTGNTNYTNVPNIGIKVDQDTNNPDNNDYFVRVGSAGGNTYSDVQIDPNNTIQIVGRLYNSGTGSGFNTFDLWINPSYDDVLTGSNAVSVGGGSIDGLSEISVIGVRTATLSSGESVDFDELVLSTQVSDVVTPEPMSLLVWGGLALAAGVAIRKRG